LSFVRKKGFIIKLENYRAIFNLSFQYAFKNYKTLVGLSIFLITCLLIFAHLWKIAATKVGAVSLDPQQLLWYIAFNEWALISNPNTEENMQEDLHSGHLAYLLSRPISYLGAAFAEAFSTLCANLLVLGSITFLFTWQQIGSLLFQSWDSFSWSFSD